MTRRLLLALAFSLLAMPGISFAQSACTAIWAIATTGTTARLAYYNNSAGTAAKFNTITLSLSGGGQANALAGDPATGLLYYFDRTGTTTYSINLNTYATATVGRITPQAPTTGGNTNILGAVIDANSNLIMLGSDGVANGAYVVAIIDKAAPTTRAAWKTVTYAIGGGLPSSGGSGDLFIDKSNQLWLMTNTNPTALYPLNLTITAGVPYGTITAATVGASVTYALGVVTVQGIGTSPVTGASYFAGVTGNQIAYSFDTAVPNSAVLTDASAATVYTVSDMGNCVVTPAGPTVTKSFDPPFRALSGATSTLSISISNPNSVPIWLTRTFSDNFPAGMVVSTPVVTSTTAGCAPSTTVTNVISANAGGNTITFAGGGRVAAGGCTITVSVTAPAATNAYTNTIAISDLGTSAGINAAGSTATYKVGTDFSVTKQQGTGTSGPYTSGTQTSPGSQTMQYVLTITNSSVGGTGSATFIDTLPGQVTPVLSITAAMTGGGSCSTASAVVGGSTVVTGTLTNALAGAICTVTITTKVSATQTVATAVTNTLTVTPISSTSDTSATNNTATVPTIIGPSANITVAKTNGISPTVIAGTSVTYTITVVNTGPSQASGTLIKDPASTGLSCFTVNCTATAGATCPAASFPYTNMTAGVTLTPFASGSTATFVVSCGVTATGLP